MPPRLEVKSSCSTIEVLKKDLKKLPIVQVVELQDTINCLLRSVATLERIKRGNSKQEVRLDDATPEELLEEKAHRDLSWDPIFNIDRDRMIEFAIDVAFESCDVSLPDESITIVEAVPVLDCKLANSKNPPDNVTLEFFRQFLQKEADHRYNGASPIMLLNDFKRHVEANGSMILWQYIDDVNEVGAILLDPLTGKEVTVDISERSEQHLEDCRRQKSGEPKIIRHKPYEDEDVYDRVRRKYRITEKAN